MYKQRFTVIVAVVLLTALAYAVLYSNILSVSSGQGNKIVVVLKSLNVRSDFWQTVKAGALAAAKQAGAELELAGPLQETDADTQIQALEDIIARKPDAIVLAPFNDRRMPDMIRRIRSAGIRLVIIDTPLRTDPRPVFVGNDHEASGRRAGTTAAALTGDRPVVAIISDSEASAISQQRSKGVLSALAAYPDSVYGQYYSGSSEDLAYQTTRSLLSGKPPFNVIVTMNEAATLGAAKAIKERHLDDSVRLIGFDSSVYDIQLMEEGILKATIVQKPFNMGYVGVRTALDMIDGKRQAQDTFIDSTLVTRDNMYTPEIQKLLFPFIDNTP